MPADHADRRRLADEVHSRPPEALKAPCRVSYLAVFFGSEARDAEIAHVARLCAWANVAPPADGANHLSTTLGELSFKWERHSEFSSYTIVARGLSPTPFAEPPASLLPAGWLAALPGRTLVAAHAKLLPAGAADASHDPAFIDRHFDGHVVVGSEVGDGAGIAYSDFRIHADGCGRFVLVDVALTPRQAGRMLQRLFEIEAYRMMALLALPIARAQAPTLTRIEEQLASLSIDHADGRGDDEALLHTLSALAAQVESGLALSEFRFSATRAYDALVTTRIGELRERRIAGVQTISEFMARRFAPAVGTCATVSQRLHGLSERIAQASALLSTRVGIAREKQNQALLASMDRRVKIQLRLQEAVETRSIVAIVYYAAGLVGYLAKAAQTAGLDIEPDLSVGISIPAIAVVVLLAIRRARRRVRSSDER